jgi:hypothetical protein
VNAITGILWASAVGWAVLAAWLWLAMAGGS